MGELHIILGCMYSGKTSSLIKLYTNLRNHDINVCAINYIEDKRYHDTLLSSHDNEKIASINLLNLANLYDNPLYTDRYSNSKYILINEAQFFTDLKEFVLKAVEIDNKIVYLYGLDGDFQREKFGSILDLIPYSNSLEKLHAICNRCSGGALFSHRLSEETAQKVIGSTNYVPLCRSCYINFNSNVSSTFSSTVSSTVSS